MFKSHKRDYKHFQVDNGNFKRIKDKRRNIKSYKK